jgi:excisionase family DNA binding protein
VPNSTLTFPDAAASAKKLLEPVRPQCRAPRQQAAGVTDPEVAVQAAACALAAAIVAAVAAATPAVSNEPERLWDVKSASTLLGIGRSTLYTEIAAGRLQSVKVGRRRLIASGAISRYIADRHELGR